MAVNCTSAHKKCLYNNSYSNKQSERAVAESNLTEAQQQQTTTKRTSQNNYNWQLAINAVTAEGIHGKR